MYQPLCLLYKLLLNFFLRVQIVGITAKLKKIRLSKIKKRWNERVTYLFL